MFPYAEAEGVAEGCLMSGEFEAGEMDTGKTKAVTRYLWAGKSEEI